MASDNKPSISPELNRKAMDLAYDANLFWERSEFAMMDRSPIRKSFDHIAAFRQTGDEAELDKAAELLDTVRDFLS